VLLQLVRDERWRDYHIYSEVGAVAVPVTCTDCRVSSQDVACCVNMIQTLGKMPACGSLLNTLSS